NPMNLSDPLGWAKKPPQPPTPPHPPPDPDQPNLDCEYEYPGCKCTSNRDPWCTNPPPKPPEMPEPPKPKPPKPKPSKPKPPKPKPPKPPKPKACPAGKQTGRAHV